MPKQDTFTRDIRQRVKQSFGAPVRYGSGVAKLFLASSKDFLNNTMPAPAAMLETNRELLDDAVRFLRAPTDAINRQVNRALATDDFKALQKFGKNALEDLKSGKFYDPDRDRTELGAQMDFDIESFGGVDMEGFDESGDWGEISDESQDIKTQIKIANAQEESASKRTGATIDAIGASTSAIVSTENANAQMSLRMSMKQHSQSMNASKNILTAQTAMFELVNRSVNVSMEVAKEAHSQLMSELGGVKSLLTEIRDNTKPVERPQNTYKEQESVFGEHGELDIKKYLKSVVKNTNEKFGISSMLSTMTMGMSMKDMLELVADNPWKLISDLVVSNLVNPKYKKQMEQTNRNLEAFFPALLQKFSDRGKLVEEGKSTRWQDALMGIFGIQSRSKSTIDTKVANPLERGIITNKFTKAVEEVIPMWLARIDSHISGTPLMVYNYTTGKLERATDVVQRTEHNVRDLTGRLGEGASEIFDRANIYKFETRSQQKDFENFLYQYLQKMAEEGKFINPNQDKETFMASMPGDPSNKKDFYYNLLTSILNNMDKSKLMQLSREMYDARAMRDQNTNKVNQELQESGLIGAWSGFLDENVVSKLRTETRKRRNGMTADEIEETLSKERKRLRENGNPGMMNSNALLNDILGTLRKGIVTYSYNLGQAGQTVNLSDTAKDVIKTASNQRSLDSTIAKNLGRSAEWRTTADERDREAAEKERQNPDRTPSQFIVSSDMSAMDIDEIQKDFIARHVIEPNNQGVENYRRALGGQVDAVKGKRDELAQKSGAAKLKSLLEGIADKPFQLFDQALKITDAFMLKALFGEDAVGAIDVDEKPDLLKLLTETLNAHMANAKDQFIDKVADPMKDYLLNERRGLLPRIGARVKELLSPIGDKIKDKAKGVVRRITGEREEELELDENGNPIIDEKTGKPKMKKTGRYKGGRLSGAMNTFTDAGGMTRNSIMNAVNRLLYGDYANSSRKGVGEQSWIAGPDGLEKGSGKQYGGVIGRLKQGFDSIQDLLFGPDSDDPDDKNGSGKYAKRRFREVTRELNKAAPDMVIGGGVGLLASMFLPGGPLLGALVGSTAGLVNGSDKLKTWLFGEQEDELVRNKDGTPKLDKNNQPIYKKTRKGALISKEVYEGISKFAPAVTKGSLLGAAAGGLGILPFGLGSTAGMVIGAIGGMTGASDQVKELIFGDGIDPDSGLISKNFKEKVGNTVKKYAPATLAGALGGHVLGGVLDAGLGLIPGLSIIPGGPLMTLMGSMVGMANSDAFNKFFFGEEVEETVTDTDKNGKEIKRTKKVRKGGLFGKAYDFTRDKIFAPVAKKVDEYGKNISGWFKESVVGPLSRSMEPLRDSMERAGKSVIDAFSNIGNHITSALFKVFNIDLGEGGFKDFVKNKLMPKLNETTDKFFSAIGKVIGNILSAPFKALEYLLNGTIGGKSMDEIRDERSEARHRKQSEKAHKRAEKHASRNMKRAKASKDSLIGRLQRTLHPDWYDANGNYINQSVGGADETQGSPNVIHLGPGEQPPTEGQQAILALPPHEESKDTSASANADENIKAMANDVANKAQQTSGQTKSGEGTKTPGDMVAKTVEEEQKEQQRREETEKVNREKNTKGRNKRDATSYLKELTRYTRAIRDEIKGQLGGVGWNTAYIKTLLENQYGPLSSDQLPEEMEGSTKNVKKKRGIFGKIKDRASDVANRFKDKASDVIQGVKDKVSRVVEVVSKPFELLGAAAKKAGSALKTFGSGVLQVVKDLYSGIKEVGGMLLQAAKDTLATVGNFLVGAAKGIGETIGNTLATVTGVIRDVVGTFTSTARTLIETMVSYVPDALQFLWKGAKGIGKLGVKAVKGVAGKAKDLAGGAINFIGDHLPGGKKRKEERKERYKNIGTFNIAGGKLEDVTVTNGKLEDVTITHIGTQAKAVPFPHVHVINGIARAAGSDAIPVYILGVDPLAKIHNIPAKSDSQADQRAADQDFKNAYDKADRLAENSSNPGEAYDKAIANVNTAEEMQAVALAQQMNTNSQALALPATSSESSGSWLSDLLSGSGGGILSTIKNLFTSGGGGGLLSTIGAMFGATKIGKALTSLTGKASSALGTVSDLFSTASTGLAPIAIGSIVNKVTGGPEDIGVTNNIKGVGQVVKNILTDKDVYDAAGNLTKIGWGTKIANAAHNFGTKLLASTADDAVLALPGATTTAAKSGLLGKITSKICSLAQKALNSKIVQKILPDSFLKKGSEVLNLFKKQLGTALANVTTESLEQFAKKLGIVITVVTTAYDIISGFNEAANILKIDSANLTTGMRVAAGLAKGLSGLAFGLLPVSWLAELLYDIFADDDAEEALDSSQAKFKESAASVGMSVSDYNNTVNKTTWQSIKDKVSGWFTKKDTSTSETTTDGSGPGLFGTGTGGTNTSLGGSAKLKKSPITLLGEGIGNQIMSTMSNVISGGKKALPGLFSLLGVGVGTAFSNTMDEATGTKGAIVGTIASGVSSGVSSAITGTDDDTTFIGKVKKTASNAWSSIKKFFGWGTGGKVTPMSQRSAKYNQDSNDMALAGCGPTAAAMVASAYGTKLDPKALSDMSYNMGMRASDGGTNPAFFGQVGNVFGGGPGFGMKQGPNDPSLIQENLKKGQPVVLMGKGGPFGGNMHYLVADGMGSGGQMSLVDPLSGARKTSPSKSVFGNTATTVYSYGKGAVSNTTSTSGSNTVQDGQKAVVNQMASVVNQLKYSTNGGTYQNPDVVQSDGYRYGSCASTVGWAYHHALGVSGMSAGANIQSGDSRFSTIYIKQNGTDQVPLDILQPGDILYQNHKNNGAYVNKSYNELASTLDKPVGHAEMYVGDGQSLSHGGPNFGDIGPSYKDMTTAYRRKSTLMVRRYTPFIDGTDVQVLANPTVSSTGTTTSGTTSSSTTGDTTGVFTSGTLDFSNASSDNAYDLFTNVISTFDTKLDNALNYLLNGTTSEDDDTSDDTSTSTSSTSSTTGTTFNFGTSAGTTNTTEAKSTIWNWLRSSYGLTEPGAAGLMGCWQAESANTPNTLEGAYAKTWTKKYSSVDEILANNTNLNDYVLNYLFPYYDKNGTSYSASGYKMSDGNYYPGIGLAQWTRGRAYNLMQFAKNNNLDWRDVNTQLKFFQYETQQSYPKLKDALNAASTPEEGARAALDGFEMSSGWSNTTTGKKQLETRANYAAQIYNTYHGSGTADTSTDTSSSSVTSENTGDTGAGPGLKTFSTWGTGSDTNLNELNTQISNINRVITKTKEEAEEGSTVAQVTDALTSAVEKASGGTGDETSAAVLKLLTSSLGQMIQLLSAIKDNTDKTTAEDTRGEYPSASSVPKARANEVSDTGVGVNDNDIGKKIMDALTIK